MTFLITGISAAMQVLLPFVPIIGGVSGNSMRKPGILVDLKCAQNRQLKPEVALLIPAPRE
jgi:hypothetical protein